MTTTSVLRLSVLTMTVLGLLFIGHASALPVTIDYTGVISGLNDVNPGSAFSVGDAFSGSFTFESDVPSSGIVRLLTAASWATSYYSLTMSSVFGSNFVVITDPSAPDLGVDGFNAFVTGNPIPMATGLATPDTFSLHRSFPLADLQVMLAFSNVGGLPSEIDGRLTTFTLRDSSAVPEPATLVLLGTGLLGAVIGRRRTRTT